MMGLPERIGPIDMTVVLGIKTVDGYVSGNPPNQHAASRVATVLVVSIIMHALYLHSF